MKAPTRAVLTLTALLATTIAGAHEPDAADLVTAHRASDLTALTRTVRAMPERTLAAMLTHGTFAEQLAAVHAAPLARDPIALVAPLARAMAAGDPEIAPDAARALLALTDGALVTAREHRADEVRADLAPALALGDTLRVRPDLAAVALALRAWSASLE